MALMELVYKLPRFTREVKSVPTAVADEENYEYEILVKFGNSKWEHCDYAKDTAERDYLLGEYHLAYQGMGAMLKARKTR